MARLKKVGHQGTEGSYSAKAARVLADKECFKNFVLVPLVSSRDVLAELRSGSIDYGIVAVSNSTAGPVRETQEALQPNEFRVVDSLTLRIVHSLFVKSADIAGEAIHEVRSHEQALAQCKGNLAKFLPNAALIPIEDTAIGAARLSKGEYGDDVAVICSRDTGDAFGLHLLQDSIQDVADNRTTFSLFAAKRSRIRWLKDALSRLPIRAVTKANLDKLTKLLVVLTILAGILAKDLLGYSSIKAAMTIGGFASTIFLLLTSRKLDNYLRLRAIQGYWRYSVKPDGNKPIVAQQHDTPRVVFIKNGDSGIEIRGWLATNPPRHLFKSTEVVTTPFGSRDGQLIYRYKHADDASSNSFLEGVVSLSWHSEYPASRVHSLSGWYVGRLTGDVGVIQYQRITKDEFQNALGSLSEVS